jgi:hypothetical protein
LGSGEGGKSFASAFAFGSVAGLIVGLSLVIALRWFSWQILVLGVHARGFIVDQDRGDADVILGDLFHEIVEFGDFQFVKDLFDLTEDVVLFFEYFLELVDG